MRPLADRPSNDGATSNGLLIRGAGRPRSAAEITRRRAQQDLGMGRQEDLRMGRQGVTVEAVDRDCARDMRPMLDAYLCEFAAMAGERPELDADGYVRYDWWEAYWSDPGRFPLGIFVGGHLRGFCLLRDTGAAWEIAEFYVEPSHRRRRVGTAAVAAIKRFCCDKRRHAVVHANTMRWHTGGLAFWLQQGFVTKAADQERLINVATLDCRDGD